MLHPYTPKALGYIGMRAPDLDEWKGYATSLLGLQVVDATQKRLAFRMDDRKQRLIVDHDGGQGHRLLRLGDGGCRRTST